MTESTGEGPQPKEMLATRCHDLQANLLSVSNGEFADTSKATLHSKLQQTTEDRWDWQSFQQLSKNERNQDQSKNESIPPDQWKEKFKGWVTKLNQDRRFEKIKPRLNSILSAIGLNDPNNITDEALDGLLQKYAYDENGIKSFVLDMVNNLPPDDFEGKLPLIKNVASRFFGKDISGLVVAQIIDLETQVKLTGNESAKLDDLALRLSEAAKNPSAQTKSLIDKIKELFKTKPETQPHSKQPGELAGFMKNTDKVGGFSDIGTDIQNHPNQEDRYGIFSDEDKTVGVVADGITFGGGGDLAAENAVKQITASLSEGKEFDQNKFEEAVRKAKETNTVGTTTVAIGLIDNNGVLRYANVGDTNIYVFDGNSLTQISTPDVPTDEEIEKRKKEKGEDIAGGVTQDLKSYNNIHYGEQSLPEGGIALILSDGVYKVLVNDEIKQIVTANKEKPPAEISQALVEAAKAKGTENITAVVLKN